MEQGKIAENDTSAAFVCAFFLLHAPTATWCMQSQKPEFPLGFSMKTGALFERVLMRMRR